jgi:glycosyltransferase involved in cell wall biosynthesis
VPAHKIVVIPNGTDLDRVAFDPLAGAAVRAEFGLPADSAVTGLLGRLDPTKRFDLVIESAAPLLGERCRLLVVGDGTERARLEDLATRRGVAGFVTFTGERHDVAAMFSAMDLFVCSSAQETFGLSVLEAMANGLPVLYTTCPALERIETGRARRVAGEVPAMRAAIADALGGSRPARGDEPAIRARYGMRSVAAQVDDLYERLLARRNGRPAAGQLVPVGPAGGAAGDLR